MRTYSLVKALNFQAWEKNYLKNLNWLKIILKGLVRKINKNVHTNGIS